MSEEASWRPEFEEILRERLYSLHAGQPLDRHEPLRDLGLDSLDTVALIVDLEEHFEMSFDDDQLTPATFETAQTLWAVVARNAKIG